jgi:hypothetical protein
MKLIVMFSKYYGTEVAILNIPLKAQHFSLIRFFIRALTDPRRYSERRDADKFWRFLFHLFLVAAQPKEFCMGGLKKLEQRSHKCVQLKGNM